LAAGDSCLTLPAAERTRFEKNFIKTAVCELRYPALLEFETNSPVQLHKEFRKDFPHYERQQSTGVDGRLEITHHLKSKKGDWLISLKPWAIAIQTNRYTDFEDFFVQLKEVIRKSSPFLDTDFFTRVGLRYINEIHIEDEMLQGWIRDELVSPVIQGVYGRVDRFLQEVRGTAQSGKYSFRHGTDEGRGRDLYTLDFDFYNENVELDAVLPMVNEFNKESFRFFLWAIGPKVRERMGKVIADEGKK
jgi:uncharacterized protein (TIGR04255 family)